MRRNNSIDVKDVYALCCSNFYRSWHASPVLSSLVIPVGPSRGALKVLRAASLPTFKTCPKSKLSKSKERTCLIKSTVGISL